MVDPNTRAIHRDNSLAQWIFFPFSFGKRFIPNTWVRSSEVCEILDHWALSRQCLYVLSCPRSRVHAVRSTQAYYPTGHQKAMVRKSSAPSSDVLHQVLLPFSVFHVLPTLPCRVPQVLTYPHPNGPGCFFDTRLRPLLIHVRYQVHSDGRKYPPPLHPAALLYICPTKIYARQY